MPPDESISPTSANPLPRDAATEQTPLLREETQQAAARGPEEAQDSDASLAQEPTTKELILILGSVWVGVFLAALGMDVTKPARVNSINTRMMLQIQPSLLRSQSPSRPPSNHCHFFPGWQPPI